MLIPSPKIKVVTSGTSIKMTVANKRRMVTLEIVEMAAEILTKYGQQLGMQKKTQDCCKRIYNRIGNLRDMLFSARDTKDFAIKPKEWHKLDELRKKCLNLILTTEGSTGKTCIDQTELTNAALVLVSKEQCRIEDVIQKSNSTKLKNLYIEWNWLINSLITLYTHLDPTFSEESRIKLGDALAHRITDIVEGRVHKYCI